jgi:hypothetical protein
MEVMRGRGWSRGRWSVGVVVPVSGGGGMNEYRKIFKCMFNVKTECKYRA